MGKLVLLLWSQFAEQHNVKVSVNDIIIKAVATALRSVPEANGKMSSRLFYFGFLMD